MNDWQTGTPPAPGLYLTIEPFGENVDIGLRPFGHNHQWGGCGVAQPVMWLPIPTPPGYQPLQVDPFMLEKAL